MWSESEMWTVLAALIIGTKGEAIVTSDNLPMAGLCIMLAYLTSENLIDACVHRSAYQRVQTALWLKRSAWLHEEAKWDDGVRANWCLKFAQQAKRDEYSAIYGGVVS
jgi:hypothetical protein